MTTSNPTSNLVTELKVWMASDAGRKFACVRNYPFLDKKHDPHCEGCLIVASLKALESFGHEALAKWESGCTGKHGSQAPCVESSAHETSESPLLRPKLGADVTMRCEKCQRPVRLFIKSDSVLEVKSVHCGCSAVEPK